MTRDEALVLWGRLCSHWPRLGGAPDDPTARERTQSWVRALMRIDVEVGWVAVDQVIESHREARLPVFADVQEASRRVARQRIEEQGRERRQLEAGTFVPMPREKVSELIGGLREVCTRGKHSTGARG